MTIKDRTIALALIAWLGGCGQSGDCKSMACGSSAASYQVCVNGGSTTYNFGGMSCACPTGDMTQCQSCALAVAGYCAGGGNSLDGGAGDLASVDLAASDLAAASCVSTFSGGITATMPGCRATVTAMNASSWQMNVNPGSGAMVPGTPYTWNNGPIYLSGMPATGDYSNSAIQFGSTSSVAASGGSPNWTYSPSGPGVVGVGSCSLSLSALGPVVMPSPGISIYNSPHGTVSYTLHDLNNVAPDVNIQVTF